VSVAVAGIESGANLDVDRFGFSVEAMDINEMASRLLFAGLRGSCMVLAQGPGDCLSDAGHGSEEILFLDPDGRSPYLIVDQDVQLREFFLQRLA
jgi:hypothetical protein